MFSKKKTFWNADFGPFRPISHEILEPRILLSGDGLLSIAPDPLQDAPVDSTPQVVQYAELLETNDQVEDETSQELDPSGVLDAGIYEPIYISTADDGTANDEGDPAQTSDGLAALPGDSVVHIDSQVTATEAVSIIATEPTTNNSAVPSEDGGMPTQISDVDLSIEYATSIGIRGPPVAASDAPSTSYSSTYATSDVFAETFDVDGLQQFAAPDLPGLKLVDSDISSWEGQIVYVDFDGAEDVTYNGSVVVEGSDILKSSSDSAELAWQEEATTSITNAENDQGVDLSQVETGEVMLLDVASYLEDVGLVGISGVVTVAENEMIPLGIGPYPNIFRTYEPHNEVAADTTNTDDIMPGGDLGLDLTGAGLSVGVWEAPPPGSNVGGGVRDSHQEFNGRVVLPDNEGVLSDHATHVAGTIAASGVDPSARGMATQVQIRSWTANNAIAEMDSDAQNIVASNHSYGFITGWEAVRTPYRGEVTPSGFLDVWFGDYSRSSIEDIDFGKYDSTAVALDQVLHSNPELLSVWSAGNDRNDQFVNASRNNTYLTYFSADPGVNGWHGRDWYLVNNGGNTIAPPGDGNGGTGYDSLSNQQTAKNSLVVGAIHDLETDPYASEDISIAPFSSFGPTDDGRIKPDVVANGVDLHSSRSRADNSYEPDMSGTSMAAPNVTGTAVLLIEHYEDLFNRRPSSATTKAVLIHTASDAGNAGPDYAYGWGLIDAAKAATFLSNAAATSSDTLVEGTYSGSEQTWQVTSDGTQAIKATIVWNDPAGTAQDANILDDTTAVLVNDLDLWITGPGGTYYPWTIRDPLNNPDAEAVRTTQNHLDNVEQVMIDSPVAGTYTIHLGRTGQTFTQDFTLLISSGSSSARTLFVDAENAGSSPNGTVSNPFATITDALAVAGSGTRVHVAPGTYVENIVLPDNVWLEGSSPNNTAISGGESGNHVIVAGNNSVVSGFMVLDSGTNNPYRWAGVYVPDNASAVIRNCIFNNNDFGVYVAQGGAAEIVNNTIHANHSGIEALDAATLTIVNNTITDCFTGIYVMGNTTSYLSHNNLWNNSYNQDYYGVEEGEGDIHQSPQFQDASNRAYLLRMSSPLVDAGDPEYSSSAEPGASAERIDIGAFGNTQNASGPLVAPFMVAPDDGTSERSAYQQVVGDAVALHLTVPHLPFHIEKVYVNIVNYGSDPTRELTLQLFGDGGIESPIQGPIEPLSPQVPLSSGAITYSNGNSWVEVDLSEYDLVVEDPDLFVSLTWNTSNQPEVGVDLSRPEELRTWIFENGEWQLLADAYPQFGDQNIMVRVLGTLGENVQLETLTYDDGVPERDGYQQIPGDAVALRITPESYPFALDALLLNFVTWSSIPGDPQDELVLRLYSGTENGPSELLSDQRITFGRDKRAAVNENEWLLVDLSSSEIVITEGDIFASLQWITPNSPSIGIDTSSPNEYRTWLFENAEWQLLGDLYPQAANDQAMIRLLGHNMGNILPVVDAGSDQAVNEGQTVSLGPATFTDPDLADTHTAVINWGDGTSEEAGVVDQDTHTVSGTHLYADNGTYTVTVTVTDNNTGVGSNTLTVAVNNVGATMVMVAPDDGTAEDGGRQEIVGDAVALHLTVPHLPFEIQKVFVNIVDYGSDPTKELGLQLFSDGGAEWPNEGPLAPISPQVDLSSAEIWYEKGNCWVEVDLSEYGIVVDDPDLFVSLIWKTSNAPSVGVDLSRPDEFATWIFEDGEWQLLADAYPQFGDQNIMVRVLGTIGEEWRLKSTSYDDGVPDTTGFQETPGDAVALRLTPDSYPYNLDGLLLNFVTWDTLDNPQDEIDLRLYSGNETGPTELIFDQQITYGRENRSGVNENDWLFVDLSNSRIVIDDGDVFVSLHWITPESPQIAIDTSSPNEYRTWLFENDEWQLLGDLYPQAANDQAMIRLLGHTSIAINNVPVVDAGSDQTVNEGQTVSLDPATFNDLGTLDTHTATIDWGDGTSPEAGVVTENPSGPPGSTSGTDGTVSRNHVYADNGVYTVTVTVTDDEGASGSDTFTITVNNVAPTMIPGADQTINEGQEISLDLATFNDLGTLDTHTATIDWGDGTAPEAGVVTETPSGPPGSTSGADGAVSGSHAYADVGTYTVTVTVTDDEGAPASGTLTVTVKTAPVALDDAYATNEDAALVIAAPGVLGNDTDVDGDSLTAVQDTGPSNGSLTFNADGSFTYMPNPDYYGPDSFTYHANDGALDSNIATVTITVNPVNDAPATLDNAYAANEDTALVVAAPGVLGNDTDVDGDPLTAVLDVGPSNGSLTLNADGGFTYTPDANYNGSDSFTYHANDAALDSNIATVTITVNPMPDAPVAVHDAYSTDEDTALVIAAPGVLGNDTDIDGDPLTAVLDTGPMNGTLTLNADGSFTYTPNADYNGPDSFTYHANDGALDSNIATVTITVNPVNDSPVALDDAYATNEDTALVVAAPGVLGNDTDVDGDPLTAVLDVGPSNGTLALNANGSFTYTPSADYNGPDTFTYHANDGALDSNIATVAITVNPVNDAPVAVDDAYATNEDVALVVAAPGVLANDSDVDGDPLTAVLDTGPSNGTLALNTHASFTYTPNADYNGPDSFTYHANDGVLDSNIATVTITVHKDSDSDGINDVEEQGPAGDNGAYDGNDDGIADCEQANVASFHAVTDDYVTLATPDGVTPTNVSAIENPSPVDFPAGVEAPCGFFEFTINGVATGGATTVTLILPVSISSYYKYGPTSDNPTDHWYEFLYDGQTGAVISGNVVTLHFIDGQRGDHDITANGTIVDPGGPAMRIRRRFTLPRQTVKRLKDIFATVHHMATSYFGVRLFTRDRDPFVVLKSVHDFSPITRGLWPESFGVVPRPDPEDARIVTILLDGGGIRLANLKVLAADMPMPITEEEMDMPLSEELEAAMTTIESDIMNTTYASAREWRQALFDYISRLILERGWPAQQAITCAMEIYGPTLREIGGQKAALYITVKLNQLFPDGGAG